MARAAAIRERQLALRKPRQSGRLGRSSVPSIPSAHNRGGYDEDGEGNLVPYAGKGGRGGGKGKTPGPGYYSPNDAVLRPAVGVPKIARYAPRSRMAGVGSESRSESIPGPGAYSVSDAFAAVAGDVRKPPAFRSRAAAPFNSSGPRSQLANAQSTPGPGAYDVDVAPLYQQRSFNVTYDDVR